MSGNLGDFHASEREARKKSARPNQDPPKLGFAPAVYRSRNLTLPVVSSYTAPTRSIVLASIAFFPEGIAANCFTDQRTLASTAARSLSSSVPAGSELGRPGLMSVTSASMLGGSRPGVLIACSAAVTAPQP